MKRAPLTPEQQIQKELRELRDELEAFRNSSEIDGYLKIANLEERKHQATMRYCAEIRALAVCCDSEGWVHAETSVWQMIYDNLKQLMERDWKLADGTWFLDKLPPVNQEE